MCPRVIGKGALRLSPSAPPAPVEDTPSDTPGPGPGGGITGDGEFRDSPLPPHALKDMLPSPSSPLPSAPWPATLGHCTIVAVATTLARGEGRRGGSALAPEYRMAWPPLSLVMGMLPVFQPPDPDPDPPPCPKAELTMLALVL